MHCINGHALLVRTARESRAAVDIFASGTRGAFTALRGSVHGSFTLLGYGGTVMSSCIQDELTAKSLEFPEYESSPPWKELGAAPKVLLDRPLVHLVFSHFKSP